MSQVNLDSLLDISLDDLADLPEFKVFNPGAHRCTFKMESKAINNHPSVEVKLTLLETVELADASLEPDAAGTESSVAYMLDNEFGQGKFKEILKPLGAHYGMSKFGEIQEASAGAEVLVVTKTRQNKDKTQTYLEIVSLQVL